MLSYRKALQCLLGTIIFLQQRAVVSADPLSTCPPPADVRCPSGEAVECNSGRFESCVYDNICTALHSHDDFDEVTCLRRKLLKSCPTEYKPVECRKNEGGDLATFDNVCIAMTKGYASKGCCNVNLKMCPLVYKPMECRGDTDDDDRICKYDNACMARGAGYYKDDCIFTETHYSLKDHECEEASEEAKDACDRIQRKNALFCGPNKCPMDNVCIAKKMGWKKFQCTTNSDCRLVKQRAICNKAYKPVVCSSSRECEYPNLCIATKGAGYKALECVKKI